MFAANEHELTRIVIKSNYWLTLRSVADNSPPGRGKGWVAASEMLVAPVPPPNPSQEGNSRSSERLIVFARFVVAAK